MKLLLSLLFIPFVATATVKIAVIDTGINKDLNLPLCATGHKSFFGKEVNDEHWHGSVITQLINSEIKDESKDYCFIIVKVFTYTSGVGFKNKFVEGIEYVSTLKDIDIVNISGGGLEYDEKEKTAIEKLLNKGVVVVVAAGNLGHDLNKKCDYYPVCYTDKLIVAGSNDIDTSNYGKIVDIKLSGKVKIVDKEVVGTSFSAARATGGLVRVMLKNKTKRP